MGDCLAFLEEAKKQQQTEYGQRVVKKNLVSFVLSFFLHQAY